MKSKLLAVFLLVITAFLFVGCAAETTEETTITFWHNYDAGSGQVTVLETLIGEFETANPGIVVDQVFMDWSGLHDSVVLGATSGVLPDVLRGDIAFVPQFQSLDVLLKMSDFSDYADIAETLLTAPNSSNLMGTEYYGIAANTNTKILFYNTTLLTAADVSVPTTLDEVWSAATALTDSPVIGMVEPWTGIWNVGPYIWSNGGQVLSSDNSRATGYINSSIVVDVIQTLADLYQEGSLAGPSMNPGATGDTDGWAAGTYAMELDGPWREASNIAAGVDYEAIPLPPGPAGSISVLGGENFMQFNTSDTTHQEAAWKFIKFMLTEHSQVEMAKVGQMPVNIVALTNAEALAAMPLLPVFAEALQTAKARPVLAQWSEIENIIATKVSLAITGEKTVQTALDECAAQIDALLSGD